MTFSSKLRELEAAATPGPYTVDRRGMNVLVKLPNGGHFNFGDNLYHEVHEADLFVYLRNHAAAIADAVDALEEYWREWHTPVPDYSLRARRRAELFAALAALEEKP